jgi:hypothetical protein
MNKREDNKQQNREADKPESIQKKAKRLRSYAQLNNLQKNE